MHELLNQIPIADTHEHLVEEQDRLNPGKPIFPADISLFFIQYVESDLIVSGMPQSDLDRLKQIDGDPEKKWHLIRKYWPMIRHSGYGQMILNSIRSLYEFDDLNDANWQEINTRIQALPQKGYYKNILQNLCHLDHCQINALDAPVYRNTTWPEFFLMDLCVTSLCSDLEPGVIEQIIGRPLKNLDDCIEAIDRSFDEFAAKSVAVKDQSAYRRNLDFDTVSHSEARNCVQYCINKQWNVSKAERKQLEDHLFHYTAAKAAEYKLPYKMHTGYHSGHGTMPLHHLRHNAGDMARICQKHPETDFVFLHITYPHQDEAIALAKHYPNAYIDMCWSWMISPLAAVRFLKEYLLAAPVNKLFAFGGDVSIVELVPGHLELARRGIGQAIGALQSQGWIKSKQADHICQRILLENTRDLYRTDSKLLRQ